MKFCKGFGIALTVLGALALLTGACLLLLPVLPWDAAKDALLAVQDFALRLDLIGVQEILRSCVAYALASSTDLMIAGGGFVLLGVILTILGSQNADAEIDDDLSDALQPGRTSETEDETLVFEPIPPRTDLPIDLAPIDPTIDASASPSVMPTDDSPISPFAQAVPDSAEPSAPLIDKEAQPLETAHPTAEEQLFDTEDTVVCRFCHTRNARKAYVCKHCKKDLPEMDEEADAYLPPAGRKQTPVAALAPSTASVTAAVSAPDAIAASSPDTVAPLVPDAVMPSLESPLPEWEAAPATAPVFSTGHSPNVSRIVFAPSASDDLLVAAPSLGGSDAASQASRIYRPNETSAVTPRRVSRHVTSTMMPRK